MSAPRESRDAGHFARLYEADPDPWRFRSSAYEQAKYRRTIEALGDRRFRSGFEAGCSIGVLTRMLADRCEALLAVDIVEHPLAAARAACADRPWVAFRRMRVPGEWPDGSFDLIVLSEVLYFLAPADIVAAAKRAVGSLTADGLVLLVNWRGEAGDPCNGDQAAAVFIAETQAALVAGTQYQTQQYRLDVLFRR